MSKMLPSNCNELSHPFKARIISEGFEGERLCQAIDLVIMFSLRECEEFGFEVD